MSYLTRTPSSASLPLRSLLSPCSRSISSARRIQSISRQKGQNALQSHGCSSHFLKGFIPLWAWNSSGLPTVHQYRCFSGSHHLFSDSNNANNLNASASAQNPTPTSNSNPNSNPGPEHFNLPPDRWIETLEGTARAPWLGMIPLDDKDKLRQAYALLLQMVLYLGRPQGGEGGEGGEEVVNQFLLAFETAPVSSTSEIGRARRAIASLTQAIIKNISSVPLNSPLRTNHTELFGIFGALEVLGNSYLEVWDSEMFVSSTFTGDAKESGVKEKEEEEEEDGEAVTRKDVRRVEEWCDFWKRAQPVVITLGTKLDEDGFGLDEETVKKDDQGKASTS